MLLAAALAALGGACAADETGDEAMRLLALGHDGGGATVLDQLGDDFELVELEEIGLEAVGLAGVDGLAVDLGALEPTDVEPWGPIVEQALRRRLPIVFENVDDSEAMAKLVGVGVEGELLTLSSTDRGWRIEVLTDGDVTLEDDEEVGPVPREALMPRDVEQEAAELGMRLLDRHAEIRPRAVSIDTSCYGSDGDHCVYEIDFSTYSWELFAGFQGPISIPAQIASLDVDFEIDMTANGSWKEATIQTPATNGGFDTGGLYQDHEYARSYYLEWMKIWVEALDSPPLEDYGPIWWSSDFGYSDLTTGENPSMKWKLDETDNGSYSQPSDLAYLADVALPECRLAPPPYNSATYFYTPDYWISYRADPGFDGIGTYKLQHKVLVRSATILDDTYIWSNCENEVSQSYKSLKRSKTVSVDFSIVSS